MLSGKREEVTLLPAFVIAAVENVLARKDAEARAAQMDRDFRAGKLWRSARANLTPQVSTLMDIDRQLAREERLEMEASRLRGAGDRVRAAAKGSRYHRPRQ